MSRAALTRRPYAGRHRVLTVPDPEPAAGDRVVVGPIQPAAPRTNWSPGTALPAREDVLDGHEGPGVVEAAEGPYARVRLDDGRVIVGVRRSRLRAIGGAL